MLNTIRKLPSKLLVVLLSVFGLIQIVFRFAIGTILGAFITSLALYFLMTAYGDTTPFTPTELLLWFSELSDSAKIGIGSALLTIFGFILAFYASASNFKKQIQTNIRIAVSDELECFHNEASGLTTDLEIYAESVIDAVEEINKSGFIEEAVNKIEYLIDTAPDFLKARSRLSDMSVEVHRFSGKYYSLLSSLGLVEPLKECTDAFSEITNTMPFVRTIKPGSPNSIESFVAYIDLPKWKEFITCCEKNDEFISGLVGGIRGILLAPITEYNFQSIVHMIRNHSVFSSGLSRIKKK